MFLPKEFTEYTSQLMGTERWEAFLSSMNDSASVSVRLNPFKVADCHTDIEHHPVPWCHNAYWLSERPDFTMDPFLHAGAYYVQEAGSMFLDHALRHVMDNGIIDNVGVVLDLCAAPGGKSTLIRTAIPDEAWLVANEPERKRANILTENLQKQGHPRVCVLNTYARDIRKAKLKFDIIVTDVPCSGEGMFRKDEGAIREWSMANVMKCAQLQRSIIEDIWPCLNDGGILIYSTCTFNTHENEENVQWIIEELGAEIINIPTLPEWNIQPSLLPSFVHPVYRFIPGVTHSEGLFMAVLRKPGHSSPATVNQKQLASLRPMHIGIPTGIKKGKDFIPDHALALSTALEPDAYPRVELSLNDALHYLHRDVIVLPDSTPRGHIIVTYQGLPLGFVKNIGTRANNLYPKEWAIKKAP